MLLQFSFNMPESRIFGLPAWADTTTFDIEARSDDSVDVEMGKLPPEEARQQKLAMLQALLVERFKLVTHTETRELPIYELVVAKGGAKLKPNPGGNSFSTNTNSLHVQGGDDSLAILADKLADVVGRVVVNNTGMTGQFDMRVKWTPADEPPPMLNGVPDPNPAPDIFTAIQEQLGLKLEPAKGPVPVLVIDHIGASRAGELEALDIAGRVLSACLQPADSLLCGNLGRCPRPNDSAGPFCPRDGHSPTCRGRAATDRAPVLLGRVNEAQYLADSDSASQNDERRGAE